MWASNANSAFVSSGVRDSETALQSIGQYIEDYLDLVENIPNEIVRSITQLHEKNHVYLKLTEKLERALTKLVTSQQTSVSSNINPENSQNGTAVAGQDEENKKNKFDVIQKYLVAIQSISDEKLYLVQSVYEQLEMKARQLEHGLRTIAAGSGKNTLISPMKSPRDPTRRFYPYNDRLSHMNGNGNSGSASDSSPEVNSSEENGSQDAASDHNGVEPTNGRRGESRLNNSYNANNPKNNGSFSNHVDDDNEDNDADSESPIKDKKRRTKNSRGGDDSADAHRSDHNTSRGGRCGKRGFSGRSKDHINSVSSQQHNTSSTHHTSKRSKKKDSPNFLDDADPDEPLYCLCNQISFGEMIGCDNSNCQIEWFHFSCVQLVTKPKGKWYCPECRGDRSNIQRK